MKSYILQIKNPNMNKDRVDFDEVFLFESMNDLLLEFSNKFEYYKKNSRLQVVEHPVFDDGSCEFHGGFLFENKDGSETSARVCDYDV